MNMSNFTVPPPFNNCPSCSVCLPCVKWEFEQKVAVATTCGLLAGVMLSAVIVQYVKSPMLKLRKISRGFMAQIPEEAPASHV